MPLCNYQPPCSYSLTANGPSEMPQSASSPINPSPQAALSACTTPPQANSLAFHHQPCPLSCLTSRLRTQHSFPTPHHATPLFHSIPIARSAVSSN